MLRYLADTDENAYLLGGYPQLGQWMTSLQARPGVASTAYPSARETSGN